MNNDDGVIAQVALSVSLMWGGVPTDRFRRGISNHAAPAPVEPRMCSERTGVSLAWAEDSFPSVQLGILPVRRQSKRGISGESRFFGQLYICTLPNVGRDPAELLSGRFHSGARHSRGKGGLWAAASPRFTGFEF